jgi:hypothetical protein
MLHSSVRPPRTDNISSVRLCVLVAVHRSSAANCEAKKPPQTAFLFAFLLPLHRFVGAERRFALVAGTYVAHMKQMM